MNSGRLAKRWVSSITACPCDSGQFPPHLAELRMLPLSAHLSHTSFCYSTSEYTWKVQTKLLLSALTKMEVKFFQSGRKGVHFEIRHHRVQLTFI